MKRFKSLTFPLAHPVARLLAAASIALALATPVAVAQHRGDGARDGRGHAERGHRGHRGERGHRSHRGDRGHRNYRHHDRGHNARRYHHAPPVHRSRHYNYRHHGYHAPRYYHAPRRHVRRYYNAPRYHYTPRYRIGGHYHRHNRTIIVTNYYDYGLYHPPRGYHWVHDYDSGDAVLASVATGAIIGLVVGAIIAD